MYIVNEEEFKEYVLSCYPQEACGIVIDNTFIPQENIHSDPVDGFMIHETIYLQYEERLEAILHSHTMDRFNVDGRVPSYEDMKCANTLGLPWGIVHCDGTKVSDILWFNLQNAYEIPELLGRQYIPNVYDCVNLGKDFYIKYFGINVGLMPKPEEWENWNPTALETGYKELGFKKCLDTEFKYGDILFFSLGSPYINHIGIFMYDDVFIHHLYNRRSCEDSLYKWRRQYRYFLRHEKLK